MKNRQRGVLPSSDIYLHIPSEFAYQTLYYVEMAGDYQCNADYGISRDFFDMFMLFWIRSGCMVFRTEGREFSAGENSVVMLNCRSPHEFFAHERVDWSWMHVNGAGCANYYALLRESGRLVQTYDREPESAPFFRRIIAGIHVPVANEHQISTDISQILTHLAKPEDDSLVVPVDDPLMAAVVEYIEAHYGDDLSLEMLAERANLSPSHFSRQFKKAVSSTPYDFILHIRIFQAKTMLLESRETTEVIAQRCGFNSLSNFIRAFKKQTHLTPTQFRQMRF